MISKSVLYALMVPAAALALSTAVRAQSDPQPKAPPAEHKTAPRPHKVWTNEDVGTLRTPADEHIEAQDRQKEQAALAARQPAAANPSPSAEEADRAKLPARFSNPKSAEEAEEIVAWESRDIASQEEFLVTLKKELDEAPADDKEQLSKLVQGHTQVLADTRKELKTVQQQKKKFEKPQPTSEPSASSKPAAAESPTQP